MWPLVMIHFQMRTKFLYISSATSHSDVQYQVYGLFNETDEFASHSAFTGINVSGYYKLKLVIKVLFTHLWGGSAKKTDCGYFENLSNALYVFVCLFVCLLVCFCFCFLFLFLFCRTTKCIMNYRIR